MIIDRKSNPVGPYTSPFFLSCDFINQIVLGKEYTVSDDPWGVRRRFYIRWIADNTSCSTSVISMFNRSFYSYVFKNKSLCLMPSKILTPLSTFLSTVVPQQICPAANLNLHSQLVLHKTFLDLLVENRSF